MAGRWSRATLVALVVAAALAVGCGKELDAAGPEQAIKDAVERNYRVPVTDVSCPDGVDVEEGGTFQCEVELPDDILTATVTQTDDDGRVEYELAQQVLTRESVGKAIAEEYNARSVNCGARDYWVSRPGESFRCRAKDDTGSTGVVLVTIRDTEGNIDLELANE
jgi:Domain of unknown function (DUF4333)